MQTSFFTRLAALAAIASLAVALPSGCDRKVTIKAGDTCATISATHKVSTYQLMKVNTGVINAACDLHVGEEICLAIKGKDCTDVHVVKEGDTVNAISQAAGISSTTLYANNKNVDSSTGFIIPGEVLCISDHIYY